MIMKESERQEIIAAAKFLEDKGYKRSINEYFITYSNNTIEFIIGYERYYDEQGDIHIKFKKENKFYSVGWIVAVREGLNTIRQEQESYLLFLLSYIRENYDTLMQIDYCEESNKSIEAYIYNQMQKRVERSQAFVDETMQ